MPFVLTNEAISILCDQLFMCFFLNCNQWKGQTFSVLMDIWLGRGMPSMLMISNVPVYANFIALRKIPLSFAWFKNPSQSSNINSVNIFNSKDSSI